MTLTIELPPETLEQLRADADARGRAPEQLIAEVVAARYTDEDDALLWDKVVWIDPERMSGAPCFTGTRVPIQNLFDYLEGGDTIDDFLEGFPNVTREQALGALQIGKERLLGNRSAH